MKENTKNQLNDITFVIPCFNEGHTLRKLIQILKSFGAKNIMVIDDGSKDNTYRIALNEKATVLKNIKTIGFGASLLKGLYEVKTKYAFIMDADLIFYKESFIEFFNFFKSGNYSLLFSQRFGYHSKLEYGSILDIFGLPKVSKLLRKKFGIYISEPFLDYVLVNDVLLKKIKEKNISKKFVFYELIRLTLKNDLKLDTYPLRHNFLRLGKRKFWFIFSRIFYKFSAEKKYWNKAFPNTIFQRIKENSIIAGLGYLIFRIIELLIHYFLNLSK